MHYTFLIVLKFSLHQTKGLVIICNGYSTVTQMEACSLTLHIEDILMLNSSWFFLCLFLLLFYPPPPQKKTPEKTITSKFTNLHFNLFKLRVFTCMYVKLHNIACYYMYWIFFFLKHKQSLFFKHLSNPAHLFLFSLVILCKKNESIGNGEPSPS